MKRLLVLVFITVCVANAWEVKEVTDSEGIETNVIICDDGSTKAVYFDSESGEYEVTPTVKFFTLNEAADYICKE